MIISASVGLSASRDACPWGCRDTTLPAHCALLRNTTGTLSPTLSPRRSTRRNVYPRSRQNAEVFYFLMAKETKQRTHGTTGRYRRRHHRQASWISITIRKRRCCYWPRILTGIWRNQPLSSYGYAYRHLWTTQHQSSRRHSQCLSKNL